MQHPSTGDRHHTPTYIIVIIKFKTHTFSTAKRKKIQYNTCEVIGKIKPIKHLVCKSHLLYKETDR